VKPQKLRLEPFLIVTVDATIDTESPGQVYIRTMFTPILSLSRMLCYQIGFDGLNGLEFVLWLDCQLKQALKAGAFIGRHSG